MSDSVRPRRRQPTRLPRPWDSPGKNTGMGCHFLLQCMKVKSESEVAQLCPTLRNPMDCGPPGSSSMGFSRQEHWGGAPSPSPYGAAAIQYSLATRTSKTDSSYRQHLFCLFVKWEFDPTGEVGLSHIMDISPMNKQNSKAVYKMMGK